MNLFIEVVSLSYVCCLKCRLLQEPVPYSWTMTVLEIWINLIPFSVHSPLNGEPWL
jgi:hypothetical protein